MGVTVELPRALQPYAHGESVVVLDEPCASVAEVLAALEEYWPGVIDRVLTEQREVRQHVNVFVGESLVQVVGRSPPHS